MGLRAVGMVLAHEVAPARARLVQRRAEGDAQHVAGRAALFGAVAGAHGGDRSGIDAEDARHLVKEHDLARGQAVVGHRDQVQPFQHVHQHRVGGREHRGHPPGPQVEARHVAAGKVEDLRRVPFLGPGDLEDAAEGRDLFPRDAAVGLGDLGAQRDHGDGKGDRPFRRNRGAATHQRGHAVEDALPEATRLRQARRRGARRVRNIVHAGQGSGNRGRRKDAITERARCYCPGPFPSGQDRESARTSNPPRESVPIRQIPAARETARSRGSRR